MALAGERHGGVAGNFLLGRRTELVSGTEISTRLVDPKKKLTFLRKKKNGLDRAYRRMYTRPAHLPRHRRVTAQSYGLLLGAVYELTRLTTFDGTSACRART